eukprot:GHUV01047861.1.p1 GENE.GHUV01047861.1~~GHUV01047861.1.p1  ORF type:complete len:153 (-),score=22.86 GHUV01047861.1:22-480(-)
MESAFLAALVQSFGQQLRSGRILYQDHVHLCNVCPTQGHDEPFLEQWHQKLHQNTTPEDVTICEAYLAFLHSGNHDDYWRVLWDNGRMTKEYLENMHNPIKGGGCTSVHCVAMLASGCIVSAGVQLTTSDSGILMMGWRDASLANQDLPLWS